MSYVFRATPRVGKIQERQFASLSLRAAGGGGSSSSSKSIRPPSEAMELRRAEEVQKCADKGWKSALICVGNMRKGGVAPGTRAYNVALDACAGAGEWDLARALSIDMRASGATPDADTLSRIEAAAATADPDSPDEPNWGGSTTLTSFDAIDSCGGGIASPLVPGASSDGTLFVGGLDGSWPSRRSASDNASSSSSGNSSGGSTSSTSSVRGGGGSGRAFGSVAGEGRRSVRVSTAPWGIGGGGEVAAWRSSARMGGGWGDD